MARRKKDGKMMNEKGKRGVRWRKRKREGTPKKRAI